MFSLINSSQHFLNSEGNENALDVLFAFYLFKIVFSSSSLIYFLSLMHSVHCLNKSVSNT
jgi:hypothetical protein